jgi:hypothetical protein
MGRPLLAASIAILCVVPSITQAQTSSGGGARPTAGAPRGGGGATIRHDAPRLPSLPSRQPRGPIGPIAPPSAPPIGPFASPQALDRDIFRAGRRTYAPRFNGSTVFGYGGGYSGGYITDPFGYIGQPDSSAPVLDRYMREGNIGDGYLRLDVEPESAQVYVDGYYAGTVADFRRGGGRALEAGPHRIELRADGYDSQSVELRIRANDVLPYRGTLNRRDDRSELRAAAGPPKTFYVIPRCYAGTSRPRQDQLPAGCKVSDVREVPPVVTDTRSAR